MGAGKTAAQVGHAVQLYTMKHVGTPHFNLYMQGAIKKIVLTATEEEMKELAATFSASICIYDKGLTEVPANSFTAICCGIFDKDVMEEDHPLAQLKLLK